MTDETLQAEMPAETVIPDGEAEPVAAADETSVAPVVEPTIPKSRFDEVYGKWRSTERDLEYWRSLAVNKAEPVVEKAPELPTPEKYGFDDAKYQTALVEYYGSIARSEAVSAFRAEREQEQKQQVAQTFKQRETDFAGKTPDYRDKVYSNALPVSAVTAELIAESPDGPAIAYYLAENLDVARQIYDLPPLQAARELGRIEARVAQKQEAPKPKPALSQAPPPPPKLDAVDSAIDKDPDSMSIDEWRKHREKQIRRKQG